MSMITVRKITELFDGVYEHSPWVTEKFADNRTSDSQIETADIASVLAEIVEQAGRDKQLELLRAHPDLAGKLAVGESLTRESASEQAGAGLDQCTPDEFARFHQLNETYKARFGFPFILAVKGWHRTQILENFESRVDNDPDVEFREALSQVHRIAGFRIETILEETQD